MGFYSYVFNQCGDYTASKGEGFPRIKSMANEDGSSMESTAMWTRQAFRLADIGCG